MDADLAALYLNSSRAVGAPKNTPFSIKDDLTDAALARQILTDNGAPTTDLRMVLGGEAMASIRGKQAVLFKANEAGTDQLLREGVIGRIMGFNLHESFSIKRTAKSAAAGYKVNGAKKEGDIIIAISAGTGGIAAGTAVKFAGDDNQYLVVAATSSTITISAPGLRQDLADQADVSVLSEFVPNMAFDRGAFLLASRTPAMPDGGDTADDVMNVTDPVSGITFRWRCTASTVRCVMKWVWRGVWLLWRHVIPPSSWVNPGASAPLFFRRPNGRINQRAARAA